MRLATFSLVIVIASGCSITETDGQSPSPSAPQNDGGAKSDGGDAKTSTPCVPGAPELLADDESGPSAIVADATHVYWLRFKESTLVRAPVGGGDIEVFWEKAARFDLAIDDKNVYVASEEGLVAIDKTAKTRTVVGSGKTSRGIAVHGGNVAWTSDGRATYSSNESNNKYFGERAGLWSGFRTIALDDTAVYDASRGAEVIRFPLDGSPEERLMLAANVTLRSNATHLFTVGPHVMDFAFPNRKGVLYMPKAGGEPKLMELVATTPLEVAILGPVDMAVEGDEVFIVGSAGVHWARVGESFKPLTSKPTVSELQPTSGNNGIAVNATHVFWTGHGLDGAARSKGQVYRVARCK